jgi:anthranilate phosphoribosyltransferase
MKTILQELFSGNSLTREQAQTAMDLILQGKVSNEQAAAFLGALQVKRESTEEIIGFVQSILKSSVTVRLENPAAIDVCGTGGDQSGSFNISTAVALVLAASGATVAKHGNRSVSSRSGSTDVLEALGIPTSLKAADAVLSCEENGFGFFFAPQYHPVLAKVGEIRKNLGVRTTFNILGPLLNPARVKRQLLGIYDPSRLELMANVLLGLGTDEAFVVSSDDGLDEISISAPTKVVHLKDGKIRRLTLNPEDFGVGRAKLSDLKGGDAKENAAIILSVIQGEKSPRRDVVLINAAAALVLTGLAKDLKAGFSQAAESVDSGKAARLLEKLRGSRE